MQVILREDVEYVGKRGEVVNVAPGFARNYLLRRRLALPATQGNIKTLDLQKDALALREQKDKVDAEVVARELEKWEVVVSRKAGESGALFGSVTSSNVAEHLATKGISIDRRKIQMREPVKMLGRYDVPIRLHRDVTVALPLHVVGETQKEHEGLRERAAAAPPEPAPEPAQAAAPAVEAEAPVPTPEIDEASEDRDTKKASRKKKESLPS